MLFAVNTIPFRWGFVSEVTLQRLSIQCEGKEGQWQCRRRNLDFIQGHASYNGVFVDACVLLPSCVAFLLPGSELLPSDVALLLRGVEPFAAGLGPPKDEEIYNAWSTPCDC